MKLTTDGRMPQLDSLRAFAVGAIMLLHFFPSSWPSLKLPLTLGVELFFVLSGFLITGILLRGRPTAAFVGTFYARRALRLFPLYYVSLAALFLASSEARSAWSYYALYGVNLWVTEHQSWGVATHFWSLAVEEQFYILWPFVILWAPRRQLLPICYGLIGAALLFRIVMVVLLQHQFMGVLLPSCWDSLACGAVLALKGPAHYSSRFRVLAVASAMAAILCAHARPDYATALTSTVVLPAFYCLVGEAASGIGGSIGLVLNSPALRYLGRISYGLYVIHYLVWQALSPYLQTNGPLVRSICYTFPTVALAALSWHFMESPINRARDRIIAAVSARLVLS